MRVLVVEDEKDLNNVICKHLTKNNYVVDSAYNGKEAMDNLAFVQYDLIILDIMMPVMNGYEFLTKLRNKKIHTPVLILTAKDSVDDVVKGLDLGGDDYLIKPFDFKELLARARTIIRRNSNNTTNEIVVDNLTLDIAKKSVKRGKVEINLTSKEYEILEFLMLNKGKILTRDQIQEHVWNFDYTSSSNVIDVLIKNIRKKIDIANSKELIKTKRGLGYVVSD